MGSSIPKVLLPLEGRPMVSIVVESLRSAGIAKIVVVVSELGQGVRDALGDSVTFAVQSAPTGTGDAAATALEAFGPSLHHIVLACGDSPLFRRETVIRLVDAHARASAMITLTSAILDDPSGYGRIMRDGNGRICGIVEESKAGEIDRNLKEINGGLYAFDVEWLRRQLDHRQSADGEFVLTEVVQLAAAKCEMIASVECEGDEVLGANTLDQLCQAEKILRKRGDGPTLQEVC